MVFAFTAGQSEVSLRIASLVLFTFCPIDVMTDVLLQRIPKSSQRQLLRMQLPNLQSVMPRRCIRMTPDYPLGDLCLVELRPTLVLLQIERQCLYHNWPTVSSVHLVLRDVTSHECWCLGRMLHRPEPFDSNVFVCCVAFDLVLTCLTQFHLPRRVFVSL